MIIIGVSGKIKSGKSTLTSRLAARFSATEIAFADPLKEAASIVFKEPLENLNSQEGKAKFNMNWGNTNRNLLQRFGTESIRKVFADDFWITRLKLDLDALESKGVKMVIISDCRFENEAIKIKEWGGMLLYVQRDEVEHKPKFFESIKAYLNGKLFNKYEWWNHPSEAGYPIHLRDFTLINNASFGEYIEMIDAFTEEHITEKLND